MEDLVKGFRILNKFLSGINVNGLNIIIWVSLGIKDLDYNEILFSKVYFGC